MQRPAFEDGPDIRMRLELLKSVMRIKPGIEIVQADNQSYRDTPTRHVVDEPAPELLVPERPTHRVNDTTAGLLLIRDVPDFLDADGVDLRIPVGIQIELTNELLGQRSTGPFGQNGYPGTDIDTWFKVRFGFSGFVRALVPGSNTDDNIVFNQEIGARKAGEDIDAAFFDLFTKPAGEFVQRDDVVRMVLQGRRDDRQLELAIFGQEKNMVLVNRLFDWCAAFFPVRHQLIDTARIHHGAGNDMCPDFPALFENRDGKIFIQFAEVISGGKTSGPATDNDDVDFQNIVLG